ncbi:ATP-binding cassette domain-containing protein [Bermanella marisrubri]|uniref:Probable ATP-binding protein YheS n=1 Tax=Bermanella marisrubri TaxID=207949 RepID=Q1MZN8_9GAMM|nr:ATP-binding cassette domain-containing protein [Bermanella marisrubri]EAT11373.1 ABC transporter, ATP-binding protein, putative [Oceanobacter sp. RED65] [Bermanella marisrubri]QIZ85628.1 ATP-binding cassette domain-containing protein [Bermanella marisrubri]
MIRLQSLNLHLGQKDIFVGADLAVHDGQKLAVVGANGAGKSTLFKLLLGELVPDQGELDIPKAWRIAHMAQEVAASEQSALDYVLDGHQDYRRLSEGIANAEQTGAEAELVKLHGEFETLQGYQVPQQAKTMLAGLGFTEAQMQHSVSAFSGGWRMRLNLARALIMPSDLMMLDEPTNHLDLDAALWLEGFLQQYRGTLLLISHDRDFIDSVVDGIVHLHQNKLNLYSGNYADFERRRAERLAQQQSLFEQQQREIAHIESFITRFKAKASKAKQAQSRIKALERMERIAPAHIDSEFHFSFPNADKVSDPLTKLEQAEIGYGERAQLTQVSLQLRPGMRIGLLGANGAGKSTLIKALVGQLPLMEGEQFSGEYLSVGYFAQHQVDELDLSLSPVQHLQKLIPETSEQEARNFMGGFGFHGDQAVESCEAFSGGELARLALARIAFLKPNLLILDEPTNHLDLDMRHALTLALQDFEGAMIVVSHDRHLLANTVDEFYLVHQSKVSPFDGDLEDYRQFIKLEQQREAGITSEKSSGEHSAEAKKERKRKAAQLRQQLSPLKKAVNKLESQLETVQEQLSDVEQQLADTSLYEASEKDRLQSVLSQQAELKKQSETIEEEWMEKLEELETLESQLQE